MLIEWFKNFDVKSIVKDSAQAILNKNLELSRVVGKVRSALIGAMEACDVEGKQLALKTFGHSRLMSMFSFESLIEFPKS